MKHRFFLIVLILLLLVSAAAFADRLNSWDEVEQFFIVVAENNRSSVTFEISYSLLGQLKADNNILFRIAGRAGFSEITWFWWENGKVEVTSMKRFNCPYRIVRTESELVSAVSSMRESRAREFVLLLDQDLYNSLRSSSKLKKTLLLEGGLYGWVEYYNHYTCLLQYTSCRYWNGAVCKASSESEALAAIEEIASQGYDSFALVLDAGTYNRLTAEKRQAAFCSAAYLECCYTNCYPSEQILIYARDNQSVFFPGYDILRSVRNGTENRLPDRLKNVLQKARKMLSGITGTPAEKAIAIHDLLCRHITYTIDDNTDDDDRCIGAILNGKANCDGYSDAFLLLCGLENIPVKLVQGDAWKPSDPDNPGHMWNLILLDGTWRGVDVTWDDDDKTGKINYIYYNTGDDRIQSSLDYLTDYLPSNRLAKTDLLDRPVPEFRVETEKDLINALQKAAGMKKPQVALWLSSSLFREYLSSVRPIWKWLDLAGISGKDVYYDEKQIIVVSDIKPLGSGVLAAEAGSSGELIRILNSANRKTVTEIRIYCSKSFYSEYKADQAKIWKWVESGGISTTSIYYYDDQRMINLRDINWK